MTQTETAKYIPTAAEIEEAGRRLVAEKYTPAELERCDAVNWIGGQIDHVAEALGLMQQRLVAYEWQTASHCRKQLETTRTRLEARKAEIAAIIAEIDEAMKSPAMAAKYKRKK